MKKLLLLLPAILIAHAVFGQLVRTNTREEDPTFSEDHNEFLTDLADFMSKDSYKPDLSEAMVEEFSTVWSSFSNTQKDEIIDICTILHDEKRARQFPHFYQYLSILINFSGSSQSQQSYANWTTYLKYLMITKNERIHKLKPVFEYADSLLASNTIFESRSIRWEATTDQFRFDIDTIGADTVLVVLVDRMDLNYYARRDTATIFNTSGRFYPHLETWEGSNGRILWTRAGLDESKFYAELPNHYRLNLSSSEFSIDSVRFTNAYIPQKLLGRLDEAMRANVRPETAEYPRFRAYDSLIMIKDIGPFQEVDYEGGFAMHGRQLQGEGVGSQPAYLYLRRGNEVAVEVAASKFIFEENKITGRSAEINIPLNNNADSIYHPGVLFTYTLDTLDGQPARIATMRRLDEGMGMAPFYNSYQQINMYIDEVEWNLNEEQIDMQMAMGFRKTDGFFESANRFDRDKYRRMQLMDRSNPLAVIKRRTIETYGDQTDTIPYFTFHQYKSWIGSYPDYMIEQQLTNLAVNGFIEYNQEDGTCKALPQLYYYTDANSGKADYDVIMIESNDSVRREPTRLASEIGKIALQEGYDLDNMSFQDSVQLAYKMGLDFEEVRRMTSRAHSMDLRDAAVLDLNEMGMNIRGVDRVDVAPQVIDSATQIEKGVIMYPNPPEMELKQNRDFDFDGILEAGLLEFQGVNFSFLYDEFKVGLDSVDFMRIKVKEEKDTINKGTPNEQIIETREYVNSVIENVSGELFIDSVGNKSKQEEIERFPIFESTKTSYVYYDQYQTKNSENRFDYTEEPILEGIYNREDFFFEVNPFTIEGIAEQRFFSTTDSTAETWYLPGTFYSTIFEDIKDSLSVQTDTVIDASGEQVILSLGFYRENPESYPVYDGKGDAYIGVRLSNIGLRGAGYVDFMTSKTYSDDFIFFPEMMDAVADSFFIAEQGTEPEFPSALGYNVYVHWEPFSDSLYATGGVEYDENLGWDFAQDKFKDKNAGDKRKTPIQMYKNILYDDITEFFGTLIVSPDGLYGDGRMKYTTAEMISDMFDLKNTQILADTTSFKIEAAQNPADTAFYIGNANAVVDFEARTGLFKSNGEASFIEFPLNQYICYMDQALWDMDREEIEVGTSETLTDGEERVGSEYISVHPDQDSLRFVSYSSGFSLIDQVITCYEVDSINVADCIVFPNGAEVIVDRDADMHQLDDAYIIADTTSRVHYIYEVNIDIQGKYLYEGAGKYDYVDELDSIQTILFDNLMTYTDTVGNVHTKGLGVIDPEEEFMLSPAFTFNGGVELRGNHNYLIFKGGTSLTHACDSIIEKRHLAFEAEINPDSIYIPIDAEPKDIDQKKIFAGLFLKTDTFTVYPAFLSPKGTYKDSTIISAEGFLTFNHSTDRYEIASAEKHIDETVPGTYLGMNRDLCMLNGKGLFDFGADLGQVKLLSAGVINHDMQQASTTLDMLLGIDFHFHEPSLKLMEENLFAASYLDPVQLNRHVYVEALKEIMPVEEVEELDEEVNIYGNYRRVPKKLQSTLFFSDVKMRWDAESNSYVSMGQLGLNNIGESIIGKYVDGRIQIAKKKTGDEISIYLEISKNTWFFFSYKQGVMYSYASIQEFNENLEEEKDKNRRSEISNPPYEYQVGTGSMRTEFMTRFEDEEEEEEEDD